MENVLDNEELKAKFIDALQYTYCDIDIRGFQLRGRYVFFNERYNQIEFHSKEKDQFKQFNKFWYGTMVCFFSLKNEKFQTLEFKYDSKGLRSIVLDFFQGFTFYPKGIHEGTVELFKDFKDERCSKK
jgi:hypothetical protein